MSNISTKSRAFEVIAWRPLLKNSLRGFATIRQPSGMVIAEIAIHVRDGKAWASPPSKSMLDRDGRQMRDADDKPRWSVLITFADRPTQTAWSDAVVAAVRAEHPEVFV